MPVSADPRLHAEQDGEMTIWAVSNALAKQGAWTRELSAEIRAELAVLVRSRAFVMADVCPVTPRARQIFIEAVTTAVQRHPDLDPAVFLAEYDAQARLWHGRTQPVHIRRIDGGR